MIDNLRISLTNQCNLKCIYCAPLSGHKSLLSHQRLSFAEIERAVRLVVPLGITKVKLTGGEPLLVKDLCGLIRRIKKLPGIREVSLTTNGLRLKSLAKELKQAGLDRINISINSLQKEKYFCIAKVDAFDQVYQGLLASLEVFDLVKINVIPLRSLNDNEIINFVDLSLRYNLIVRFIELFFTNESSKKYSDLRVTTHEVKEIIRKQHGDLKGIDSVRGDGPARYYNIKGTKATIGFISNYSESFCDACSRVRIDSQGRVLPCLFSDPIYDLKSLIKEGKTDGEIEKVFEETIKRKKFFNKGTRCRENVEMLQVGG